MAKRNIKPWYQKRSFQILVGSILLVLAALGGKYLYDNRPATMLERPLSGFTVIEPGERVGYPITTDRPVALKFYNWTSQNIAVNLTAIESFVKFNNEMSDKLFGSHTIIDSIEINFTNVTTQAGGVDVQGTTAFIHISADEILRQGDVPGGISAEGFIGTTLMNEFANMAAADLGKEDGDKLGLTNVHGLNAHEREEVFSHGMDTAYASIYTNRFLLREGASVSVTYNDIYVYTLREIRLMNPFYFADLRQDQQGFRLTFDEFQQLVDLFLSVGPMVFEPGEQALWRPQ